MPYIPVSVVNAAAGAGALTLIQEQVISTAAAFDFTSIPGTYRHLQIHYEVRATDAGAVSVRMRYNGDTGNNYYSQATAGSAGVTTSFEEINTSSLRVGSCAGSGHAAGFAGAASIHILYYANTTFNKQSNCVTGRFVATTSGNTQLECAYGVWNNTAAITRIELVPSASATFVTGSIASLYGMT